NPAATSAVLDADGWYHTGDLGEFDKDGFLWLRGRKKDLIVLADGLNVYPEDIEDTLAADPRIQAAATPLRPVIATVVGLQPPGRGAPSASSPRSRRSSRRSRTSRRRPSGPMRTCRPTWGSTRSCGSTSSGSSKRSSARTSTTRRSTRTRPSPTSR